MSLERRKTREVRVGSVVIGGDSSIVVQSMTATKTQDIEGTVALVNMLERAGAGIIRVAVDSKKDAIALGEIRARTTANLSVDLQENFKLAENVAPVVDKIRYNPGHLYHHQKDIVVRDKVAWIAEIAQKNNCALRVGVNSGSVDPEFAQKFGGDSTQAMVESALFHSEILENLGFKNFVVSLKDSDPIKVINANKKFAEVKPEISLHLGVTEAGLPPQGVIKTRIAFEQLLSAGIGETLRVSLTVPFERKSLEVDVGRQIIEDVMSGNLTPANELRLNRLNIISCPSCSRVENSKFVELAEKVREVTAFAKNYDITVAVMGCRVNGPGESVDADIGLWCAPNFVNLMVRGKFEGSFQYDKVVARVIKEVDKLIRKKKIKC